MTEQSFDVAARLAALSDIGAPDVDGERAIVVAKAMEAEAEAMALAFREAGAEMRSAEASVLLDRVRFMRQAGITFKGARDLYDVLGYDRLITARQYRDRYARGGLAGRIVDVFPDATWRGGLVKLKDNKGAKTDTKFEKAWAALDKQLKLQAKLRRVDKLSRLSTFAVLLIGDGAESLSDELQKGKPGGLKYITAFGGGGGPGGSADSRATAYDVDAVIETFELDPREERFGLPKTYRLRRTDATNPLLAVPVHWSRIIHVAEDCLFDDVYGQPALERVWNLLDDLDKVTGGGAEAFWLRANQGMHLDIDKDMRLGALPAGGTAAAAAAAAQAEVDSLKQQAEDYKHQLTRWLRTRGVKATPLGSDVANFEGPADVIVTQIAGSKAIPKRILTGSEMGELASSQDRENWKDQVNGRQTLHAGPYIVAQLVDRLLYYGYLPPVRSEEEGYEVEWPHIQVLTEEEKSKGAHDWASTNQAAGKTVFTVTEIREKWYDMEPLTPEQLEDELATHEAGQPEVIPGQVDEFGDPIEGDFSEYEERAAGEYKLGSTQVQLSDRAGELLLAFGRTIPQEDLAADGLELEPHVTVKYGIKPYAGAAADVGRALSGFTSIRLALGRTAFFKGADHDVLYAEVDSPDLIRANRAIDGEADCEVSDHGEYVPHATIAYLKSGLGAKYARRKDLESVALEADSVRLSMPGGAVADVPLLGGSSNDELIATLAAAIEAGETETVDALLGLEPRMLWPKKDGTDDHGRKPGDTAPKTSKAEKPVEKPAGPKKMTPARDAELKQVMSSLSAEILREMPKGTPYFGIDRNEITKVDGGYQFSVRDFGDWVVPDDEEDDGDYDWKVPTAGTRAKLDKMIAKFQSKHPGVHVKWYNEGEKNWIGFTVLDSEESTGHFLSASAHAELSDEEFRALWPNAEGEDFHGREPGGDDAEAARAELKELDEEIKRGMAGPNTGAAVKARLKKFAPLLARREALLNRVNPDRMQAIVASAKLVKTEQGFGVEHRGELIGHLTKVEYTGFKTINGGQSMYRKEGYSAVSLGGAELRRGTRSEALEAIANERARKLRGDA